MKSPGAPIFFFFALLLLSLFQTPADANGLSGPELVTSHIPSVADDESEYNYEEGSGKGPEDWWHLKPEWNVCKFGKRQSPIDLTEPICIDIPLGILQTFHWPSPAILRNRGHDIMLGWQYGAGLLHIDDVTYELKQCHWHSPAEHEINGRRPALEMHMVHQSAENKIAVIGILYEHGPPDPFLAQLEEPLKRIAYGEKNVSVGNMYPSNLEVLSRYYRYEGSLTTPPCTEGVVWTVFRRVLTASQQQVELLKAAVEEVYMEP
ncbi:hypothetical protein Taro_041835 [Colocasia esculenta]|uniref:Alpha-carbonic anhydrase domain-containing protein n=1 Tax=Colocasia esculenta TaxID=4460 RepID=A0A843WR19_COLES|nr:hypothetical protein [Colocasia esculenta]